MRIREKKLEQFFSGLKPLVSLSLSLSVSGFLFVFVYKTEWC